MVSVCNIYLRNLSSFWAEDNLEFFSLVTKTTTLQECESPHKRREVDRGIFLLRDSASSSSLLSLLS
ncbi:hypothetical protein YC2023_000424 [Brassica napus]